MVKFLSACLQWVLLVLRHMIIATRQRNLMCVSNVFTLSNNTELWNWNGAAGTSCTVNRVCMFHEAWSVLITLILNEQLPRKCSHSLIFWRELCVYQLQPLMTCDVLVISLSSINVGWVRRHGAGRVLLWSITLHYLIDSAATLWPCDHCTSGHMVEVECIAGAWL